MLAGLRLDGLVSGDDEQHHVDAAYARQHVAHEALVAGDIDKAETELFAAGARQLKVCEADINRDTAAFFFFEPVGVNTGERFYQRGFSMIDVSCSTDDDRLHGASLSHGNSGSARYAREGTEWGRWLPRSRGSEKPQVFGPSEQP